MAQHVPLAQITLPLFVGTIMNWLLFGVLLVQIYIYYVAFPKDPRWAKLGVAAIILLELLETITDSREMVNTFGLRWGDMEELDIVGMAWFGVPIIGPLIASIGQGVFAWRIYLISQSIYLPVLISLTSAVQLAAGFWTGINISKAGRFSLLQDRNVIPTSLWLASTSLCDLLIMFGMVYYLIRTREREFSRISSAISRILFLTVETGAICTAVVLADLYLFLAFKGTNLHLALCIELSKIYSNSILLIFNSRARITHRDAQDAHISLHIPELKTLSLPGHPTEMPRADSSTSSTITQSSEDAVAHEKKEYSTDLAAVV
ncbi:hypothetical protein MIND_00997200 [Mycena indigotica]|uniref:DUF6534 domain-containing protein n=1 Tax=Mycena indigotica TaxID=2126181 RepID=A0A8H6S805_9AGAR|nr:uncharacterized protein MIND_00997200 [Mycena indigotica]KAF7294606.1 hypothetical protein MIND_00997200 [Mycena indigotica]